jgi:hypothetical protein
LQGVEQGVDGSAVYGCMRHASRRGQVATSTGKYVATNLKLPDPHAWEAPQTTTCSCFFVASSCALTSARAAALAPESAVEEAGAGAGATAAAVAAAPPTRALAGDATLGEEPLPPAPSFTAAGGTTAGAGTGAGAGDAAAGAALAAAAGAALAGEGAAAALPAVGMVRISLLAGVVAPPRLWRVAGPAPWAAEERKKARREADSETAWREGGRGGGTWGGVWVRWCSSHQRQKAKTKKEPAIHSSGSGQRKRRTCP